DRAFVRRLGAKAIVVEARSLIGPVIGWLDIPRLIVEPRRLVGDGEAERDGVVERHDVVAGIDVLGRIPLQLVTVDEELLGQVRGHVALNPIARLERANGGMGPARAASALIAYRRHEAALREPMLSGQAGRLALVVTAARRVAHRR